LDASAIRASNIIPERGCIRSERPYRTPSLTRAPGEKKSPGLRGTTP